MTQAADAARAEEGQRKTAQPPLDRQGRLLGRTVDDRYQLVEFLGSGGMGELYVAQHVRLGRRFALKVLRAELCRDRRFVERFERESRTVASLESEHIVGIVDSGSLEEGEPYFVMDLLRGQDLRRLIVTSAPLPAARVAHLGIDACRGLHIAHQAGLVHRDLKPENLFVCAGDDGRDVVKLLDFGVAKLLSGGDNSTSPGTLMGTARYMSPEQAGSGAPVTAISDIFSLGVILYECLTGVSPFEAETLERVLFQVLNHEPEPLDRLRPELPLSLALAINRALSKQPRERHASARAFEQALLASAGARATHRVDKIPNNGDDTLVDPDAAPPSESAGVEKPRPGRWRALAAISALGLTAAGLLLAQRRTEDAPQAETTRETPPVQRAETRPAPTAPAPAAAIGTSQASSAPPASSVAPALSTRRSVDRPNRSASMALRPSAPPSSAAAAGSSSARSGRPTPWVSYDPENPYASTNDAR
jgi:eukaryotic-like serine/threonine-protein kinase